MPKKHFSIAPKKDPQPSFYTRKEIENIRTETSSKNIRFINRGITDTLFNQMLTNLDGKDYPVHLDLRNNHITDEVVDILLQKLEVKDVKLSRIDLSDNFISQENILRINAVIKEISHAAAVALAAEEEASKKALEEESKSQESSSSATIKKPEVTLPPRSTLQDNHAHQQPTSRFYDRYPKLKASGRLTTINSAIDENLQDDASTSPKSSPKVDYTKKVSSKTVENGISKK